MDWSCYCCVFFRPFPAKEFLTQLINHDLGIATTCTKLARGFGLLCQLRPLKPSPGCHWAGHIVVSLDDAGWSSDMRKPLGNGGIWRMVISYLRNQLNNNGKCWEMLGDDGRSMGNNGDLWWFQPSTSRNKQLNKNHKGRVSKMTWLGMACWNGPRRIGCPWIVAAHISTLYRAPAKNYFWVDMQQIHLRQFQARNKSKKHLKSI